MSHYDILMVTDARLPGGTSASVAEEIRAQARAGYRTALLQVDSPLVRRQRPLAPRIRACIARGEVDLLVTDQPVSTDLLVLRHPTVAGALDPATSPAVTARAALMIANQAPSTPGADALAATPGTDAPAATPPSTGSDDPPAAGVQPDASGAQPAALGGLRYEPHEVDAHLRAWLGTAPRWVPIGPLVRADLAAAAPDLDQDADDWVNVIDVDHWYRPRQRSRHSIPVIGRHSRDHALKWPATREELLAVYPDRHDVEVHVLGGAEHPRRLLDGSLPQLWQVEPFGSVAPEVFLAGLDVFVYYHHPAWVEAFGRSILEAMASGVPAVLPPHFAALFEDAASYAEPAGAMDVVRSLHDDAAAYRVASERGVAFAAERFGHGVHLERLAALVTPSGAARSLPTAVAPATPSATVATPEPTSLARKAFAAVPDAPAASHPPEASTDAPAGRVLLVSSNGAGVGHLMRLMALARHSPPGVEPLFLTFSQGAAVVEDAGLFVEYLASRSISGATAKDWHPMLAERVGELIDRYDVRAVVFDGTWPYQGLLDAVGDRSHVSLVWSRRAMWRRGVTNPVLEHERDRFDLVLEPGEIAGDDDRGATRRYRPEARRLGPITYLEFDELLDPATARAELGLDPDRPAALVNLGAGNIDDVGSVLGGFVARLAVDPDLQIRVTRSIIAERDDLPDNVQPLSIYPLARYLRAFDLAVAAAGYNSFHELSLAAVPTIWVPNLSTSTDDQLTRARFADRIGTGIALPSPAPDTIDAAVARIADPDVRRRMHERAVTRRRPGGAAAGMAAITDLLTSGPGPRIPPRLRAVGLAPIAPGPGAAPGSVPMDAAQASPVDAAGSDTAALDERAARAAVDAPRDETAETAVAPAPAGLIRRVVALLRRVVALLRRGRRRLLAATTDQRFVAVARRPVALLPPRARRWLRRRVRGMDRPPPRPTAAAASGLPVPPGRLLAGTGPDGTDPKLRPVAVVLPATGDAALTDAVVERLAQLQVATRSFAPLVVVSDLDLRAPRRYGYLVEVVPGPARYARLATEQPWHDARRERLTALWRHFAPDRVVTLPRPEDVAGIDGVLAELAAGLDVLSGDG